MPAHADRIQQLLRQSGHFPVNMGPSPPWSVLGNPSCRRMWVAKHRHNLSTLLKWGWFSLFLRSHTSCWQFAQEKSKPYWVAVTLQHSESGRNWMCPQPQFTGNFWTNLIIAETEGRMKPITHTHTSLAWLLQCSTNRKRGLFSNSLPSLCCYKTVPELAALAAHADGNITCFICSPWATTKAMVWEYTCKK